MLLRCLLIMFLLGPLQARSEERLLIFAASSLQTALDDTVALWKANHSTKVVVSYASSASPARQIEAWAPADAFSSASSAWMDHLGDKGLVQHDTRIDLLSNRLALIRPRYTDIQDEIDAGFDLLSQLQDGRLVVAMTDTVPAGIYAREALTTLGLWENIKTKLAQTESARRSAIGDCV